MNDITPIEAALMQGDLAKLNTGERKAYYDAVCGSLGLNPLTRPFEYITLNGKLTLYARKDAADQLRRVHNVSIEDVELSETAEHFIVKVKARDGNGRTDVEIGVVSKKDMRGDLGNAQMKAVTKAKRRVTLSLCGLGMLDETEVESIPGARYETVDAPALPRPAQRPTTPAPTDNTPAIPTTAAEMLPYATRLFGDEGMAALKTAAEARGIASLKTASPADLRLIVEELQLMAEVVENDTTLDLG